MSMRVIGSTTRPMERVNTLIMMGPHMRGTGKLINRMAMV